MANTVTDRDHVFETFSASGIVYLTLDGQLVYWHRFKRHISINVVYDKGVPALASDKPHSFAFISNEHINYNQSQCNNASLPNQILDISSPNHIKSLSSPDLVQDVSCSYIQTVSTVYHNISKPESDINCVDNVLSASHEKQSSDDSSAYRIVEMATTVQDLVPKESDCLDSISLHTKHNSIDITIPSSVDMSVMEEVGNVEEPGDGENTADEDIKGEKEDFKDSKRVSERLSHIVLKINGNSVPKVLLKEKAKNNKLKAKVKKDMIKEDKVKAKQTNIQSRVNVPLTRLKKASEKKIKSDKKFANHEQFRKLKTKMSDTEERPRVAKVRKLELEKDVKCEYCSKTFRSQQEYFDHRKGDRTTFKCKVCSKIVPFKAHLMVHMRKHNMQEEVLQLEEAVYKRGQNSQSNASDNFGEYKSNKQITCDVCGLTVSNIPILKTHTMIHTGEYAYKCCICGEKTHSVSKHNNHLSTHLKSGKVQCKICNISFESRSDLSRHQLTHEFKCSICDKTFSNKTSRVFHYKTAHKEDILKCMICGKMFSSEEELTPHLKYHRNRAKTQCTVCGLFVTRLDNHLLSHNQRSEESKMYVCDQCPKQFKQKLSFQRHLRTHSEEKPYACMECSKKFARSGGLRRHMTIHTQEKPFVCNICGKACSQMGNLRIHMQIHKDSSPVQCKVCGESFSYKNSLQEHMRTTHYADMGSADPTRYMPTIPSDYYV